MLSTAGLLGFLKKKVATTAATFSFVTSATSTASTITVPGTAQAGDLAILIDGTSNAVSPATSVTPSTWTKDAEATHTAGVANRCIISHKILESGDISASITGMAGVTQLRKIMLIFRPSVPLTVVTPSTPTGQSTSGNPSSQVIAMTASSTPVIGIAHFYAGAASEPTVSPRTNSPAATGEVNSAISQYVQYMLYNTSPSDHTIDMDDEGNNTLQGIYYRFAF